MIICEASYATLRMVDFIKELRHKVMEDTDRAFHKRAKQAQEGVWHLEIVFVRSCLGIFFLASFIGIYGQELGNVGR